MFKVTYDCDIPIQTCYPITEDTDRDVASENPPHGAELNYSQMTFPELDANTQFLGNLSECLGAAPQLSLPVVAPS